MNSAYSRGNLSKFKLITRGQVIARASSMEPETQNLKREGVNALLEEEILGYVDGTENGTFWRLSRV